MFVPALVLALAALATAAPHYDYSRRSNFDDYFSDDAVFDSVKFWKHMNIRFQALDDIFEGLNKRFPKTTSTEGFEGNTYVVNVPLEGFEEKDITVQSSQSLLMIEASHKITDIAGKIYVDVRVLPSEVDPDGTWAFDAEVLKIKFPLQGQETTEQTMTVITTEDLPDSREEMEPHDNAYDQDADVGVKSENPVDEVESENPVDAVESENPVDEVESENPVDAVECENPVDEVESENPVDEVESENPADEVESENPADEVESENPVVEVESENSVENKDAEYDVGFICLNGPKYGIKCIK